MKALDKIRSACVFLQIAGIAQPEREAEEIISHSLGVRRVTLFRDNPEIAHEVMQHIDTDLERRARREPLQYILGRIEFHGLMIKVGPGVLIPRPETELLVEAAIAAISAQRTRRPALKFLDLCTGTGCIALTLARQFPDAKVYGTDTSETAIRYSVENANINNLPNAVFLHGSFFEPVRRIMREQMSKARFDLVISNPPYIRTEDMKNLQPEIRWEPQDALDGGEDGLDYYRIIIPEAKEYLRGDGILMFEIGINQADAVRKIALAAGYRHTNLKKDHAGIDRIIMMQP